MTVSSRAVDRVALGAAAVFVAGLVLFPAIAVYSAMTGQWLAAGFLFLFSVLVYLPQSYSWWKAAWCRIDVGEGVVRRRGPLGWAVRFSDIREHEIRLVRGVPYLVVRPTNPPPKLTAAVALLGRAFPADSSVDPAKTPLKPTMTRLFLGSAVPADSVVGPVDPVTIDAICAALAGVGGVTPR